MNNSNRQKNFLIFIVGPTAIGKTARSIEIAKHFGCEIVSCDSRQFFKEMTIGTAVPSSEELAQIPHHFIQNKSIHETYNVGDYEREVIPYLDSLFLKNKIQIVVGGSGLYVDAIAKGFDYFPEVSQEIKDEIDAIYLQNGIEGLSYLLEKHDAEYFSFLTNNNPQTLANPQRMKRFIAVCLASGKPYSSFLDQEKHQRNFTPIYIGLEAPRAIMYERINQRVDQMVHNGLLNEVKNLKEFKNLNALQTVGYREFFDFLDGQIPLETAIEEVKKNTRRFAKRQLTWFKRNEETMWFDFQESTKNIIASIEQKIHD